MDVEVDGMRVFVANVTGFTSSVSFGCWTARVFFSGGSLKQEFFPVHCHGGVTDQLVVVLIYYFTCKASITQVI